MTDTLELQMLVMSSGQIAWEVGLLGTLAMVLEVGETGAFRFNPLFTRKYQVVFIYQKGRTATAGDQFVV